MDIDGVLVITHSEKQDAAPTWKKSFGHHPLPAFVDHGQEGSGEPVAALLRLEIVSLALDLLAWMPILALTGAARRPGGQKAPSAAVLDRRAGWSPPAGAADSGPPTPGPGPM